ncbi:hypothetical protein COCC4DRAFT_45971 [Bipolaris maydis ATCC 48331]|uniref:Hydrophobin n=1 Tax=Cochliobolus heterostrophus (strain C4 / ATCC 48331 / race T) TaxID=665024 RepID=N4WE62_COCH4|nr:uncharacterized protein COCC4DRAFT_45971 [Bipolaris maydis ATCC 48331]KAJ5021260.1 hypothetical protein J3E73DRAFT_262349 [Bipolaris maydis]ENH98538.1 hypothetical protein COCC4DRAFT_45971 [Bipolaris maydis ATCC 48331]KAJ6203516.1 hypothetical protein PSV09DRAFT_2205686 [Bipolaris maydis]KAJ6265088.1 hypothetical protein PSV08DRAFT_192186 [Bipolaris maydis]KAJ6276631.1 hypothetical protein J3E71DRAFT_347606 [Bipolaris maydis]
MQFSIFTTGFLVAIMTGTALAAPPELDARGKGSGNCHKDDDCCYSSKAACERQQIAGIPTWINCNVKGAVTYCSDVGITLAQCDADCCAISTTWGRGCPA